MKLKVDHIFEATVTLFKIIREERPLPLRGSYHLARLHAKLLPDFEVINAKRDELIKSFGVHQQMPDPTWKQTQENLFKDPPLIDAPGYMIPPELQGEFAAKWKPLGDEEVEIDVQPVPLAALDLGPTVPGTLTAVELSILGELIKD